MQDTEILSQLLNLGDDWHVKSVDVDQPSNRIDIFIAHGPAKKKSLFGGRSSNDDESSSVILRHLPILGMRSFLHVPAPGSVDSNKLWAPAGSKLTNEMEAHLIELISNLTNFQIAAKISGLTAAEVREVSERTGTDKLSGEIAPVSSVAEPVPADDMDYVETKSFELIENTNIPDETHENWQRVISGEIAIQTDAVGLKMLLQRIRQDVSNNPSETTRLKSAKLLRQYFLKNSNKHKNEIALLTGQTLAQPETAATATASASFPGESHKLWHELVNNELQIKTQNVALQMMLERVKQTVERNPSDSSRQAGIKILRQFFLKHKSRLTAELKQMGIETSSATSTTTAAAAPVSIPAENATCWQQLLNGELKIQTRTVGLQMMMERVKQSVEKNNSESNRSAGIKILRQYFLKHKSSSESEIRQLMGLSAETPGSNAQITIPPETHPSWQRLIDGDLVIDTDIVALKMMLQSIRISIENNPTEASRHAGARILRQYFIKHKNKHKTELGQLIAA